MSRTKSSLILAATTLALSAACAHAQTWTTVFTETNADLSQWTGAAITNSQVTIGTKSGSSAFAFTTTGNGASNPTMSTLSKFNGLDGSGDPASVKLDVSNLLYGVGYSLNNAPIIIGLGNNTVAGTALGVSLTTYGGSAGSGVIFDGTLYAFDASLAPKTLNANSTSMSLSLEYSVDTNRVTLTLYSGYYGSSNTAASSSGVVVFDQVMSAPLSIVSTGTPLSIKLSPQYNGGLNPPTAYVGDIMLAYATAIPEAKTYAFLAGAASLVFGLTRARRSKARS